MLYDILNCFVEENSIVLTHSLNTFVLIILLILFVAAKKTSRNWNKVNDYFGTITNTIDSVRYGNLTKKIKTIKAMNIPNSEALADSLNRMVETLYDREKMVVESQAELHRQNKFLEAVINTLSDGLIIIDNKYKILRVTPQICNWFEIKEKDLIGKNVLDYIKISKRYNIENLKNNDINIISTTSGSFSASTMELNLEDRKKRFVIVIKNITNEKELDSLKEDFVATLTHDLKVPIIAETNMLELFLNESFGAITPKQQLALKNMQTSNKELLNLVQIVLNTYKLKDGNLKLYKENILLKSYVEEIIEEIKPIASKTNNKIIFNQKREIHVFADKMQLKRVIKNLLHNAMSYGDANSPIEIKIGEIPKYIAIKVKDYGKGISEEDIKHIFNKYYSAANKFRKIGTGLGLYLAKQIVKAHNGSITVESEENKYTEFTVKLPTEMNMNLHYGE